MAFNVGAFLGSFGPATVQGFQFGKQLREEHEKQARAEGMATTLGEWLKSAGLEVRDPRVLLDAVAQLRAQDVIQIGKLVQETSTSRRLEEANRRIAELLSGSTGAATTVPQPTPPAQPTVLIPSEPTLGAAVGTGAATGTDISAVASAPALSPTAPDEAAKLVAERDRLQRAMAMAVQAGNHQVANLIERRLGDVEKALEAIDTRERTRGWFLEYAQRSRMLQQGGLRPEEAARVAAVDTAVGTGFVPSQIHQLFPNKETLDDAIKRYAEIASGGDPEKFLRAVGQAKAMMLPPEQPSHGERERIAQQAALAGQLQRMAALFRPDYIGPVTGRYSGVKERTVGISPQESEFRAAVEQFKQSMITALTGAQRSAKEMELLAQIFPDVTLPPATFVGKLNQAIQYAHQLLRETREVWRQSRIDTSNLDRIIDELSVRAHLTPDGRLALVKRVEPAASGSPPSRPQIELPPRPQIDRPGSGLRP
jgi:hypothetical protein